MAELLIGTDKLQHIYDLHAEDFGLSGNKNPQQLQKLHDALESHLSDAGSKPIQGQYRGLDANLYYNPLTRNVVVTDLNNNVLAGFKASPAQARYISSTGRLN